MKTLITATLLLTALTAQAGCEDAAAKALMKSLHPKELEQGTAAFFECKAWPAKPGLSLAVATISHPAKDESVELDLDIIVYDSAKGTTLARLLQKRALSSEFTNALVGIGLDTARYKLNSDTLAFGVVSSYAGPSRVAQSGNTTISLYVPEGSQLKAVLSNMALRQTSGEWDQQCEGSWESLERTIAIAPSSHQGYADLIIQDKQSTISASKHKGACKEHSTKSRGHRTVLQFDGKHYPLPKALADE